VTEKNLSWFEKNLSLKACQSIMRGSGSVKSRENRQFMQNALGDVEDRVGKLATT
jgi:hypothetical protein